MSSFQGLIAWRYCSWGKKGILISEVSSFQGRCMQILWCMLKGMCQYVKAKFRNVAKVARNNRVQCKNAIKFMFFSNKFSPYNYTATFPLKYTPC